KWCGPMSVRGSVLLEGLVALPLLTLTILFVFDCFRQAQWRLVLQHGCFLYARYRSLGLSVGASKRRATSFVEAALGSTKIRIREFDDSVHMGFHLRKIHKRFEITAICAFPF